MARTPVKITLHKSEIIYDVQNKTMLTARSRDTGQNFEQVAHMQANNDDESINQIMRSVGNAWATLMSAASEYADVSVSAFGRVDASSDPETSWQAYGSDPGIQDAKDNLFDASGKLTAYLLMPENYNEAAKDLISAAMHQYLVNMAVADWFTMTAPTEASGYYTMAASNLVQLREACSKRKRPTRVNP